MGVAIYPVFEKKIKGATEVSGKALSRHSEAIEAVCKKLAIKTLWDFYSENVDETEAHLGEEVSPELHELLKKEQTQWFELSEGLAVVSALRRELVRGSDPWMSEVLDDITALECVLKSARKAKTRFRLVLDL